MMDFVKEGISILSSRQDLTQFDPTLIIGALGGARQNARKTLQLAHDVVRNGGRAILFGRTIFEEENPIGIAQALRSVLDGVLGPEEAHSEYQKSIRRNGGRY